MYDRTAVVLALLALLACGGQSSDAPAADQAAAEWTPTPEELERATELGRDAAGRLAGTLMQQLAVQIQEGGPASAIEFCSGEAMELTGAVNSELGALEIKRTSSRIRNPDNSPDALERDALSHFEAEQAEGSLPASWVQTVNEQEVRYYQPLVVAEMCTQCHGPVETLDAAVRARLEELYPDDQAVGYAVGDFRGLIRVAIPRAALATR